MHPSFLRGVKFNFDELQPNFLWVIIDPYRAQKGCETNVSRREIFRFFPPRFILRTLGFLVRALTTDLRCRGAASKKIKLFIVIETAQLLKAIA